MTITEDMVERAQEAVLAVLAAFDSDGPPIDPKEIARAALSAVIPEGYVVVPAPERLFNADGEMNHEMFASPTLSQTGGELG